GIGAGWNQKDYDSFGYEFGTPGSRLRLLAEYLPRIEHRLAVGNPAAPGSVPVLIGGGGEKKTLRLVAQHADIWHAFGDLETLTRKSAILAEHCAEVGTDPAAIERSSSWPGADAAQGFVDAGVTLFTTGRPGTASALPRVRAAPAWRGAQGWAAAGSRRTRRREPGGGRRRGPAIPEASPRFGPPSDEPA